MNLFAYGSLQFAEVMRAVTGRSFAYFQVQLGMIRDRMGDEYVKMYEWFDRVGYSVDRAALKREFPDVHFHNFESWAKQQNLGALVQTA